MPKKYLVSLWLTGYWKWTNDIYYIYTIAHMKWEWMIKMGTHVHKTQTLTRKKKMVKTDNNNRKKSTKFPEFKRFETKRTTLAKEKHGFVFYLRNWYYHFLFFLCFFSFVVVFVYIRKMWYNKVKRRKSKKKM